MKIKNVFFMLFVVLLQMQLALAGTITDGISNSFENATLDNVSLKESTGYLELSKTINDYILYFNMDENSGNSFTNENTTNNITGTFTSTLNSSHSWENGSYGYSLNFTESNGCVVLSSITNLSSANGTISFDIYVTDTGAYMGLVYYLNQTDKFEIYQENAGDIRIRIEEGGTQYVSLRTPYWVLSNGWNNVVLSQGGSGISIRIDGVSQSLVGTNNNTLWTNHIVDGSFSLGRSVSYYWDDKIDEFYIYNYELSLPALNETRLNYHTQIGNISRNYTSEIGAGDELKTMSFNGTLNNEKVDLFASVNGVNWILKQLQGQPDTPIDISSDGYKYAKWRLNTTNQSLTPTIFNVSITYGSATVSPSITSSSPLTPAISFVNESKTFNAGSNQIGNWTWFIDSVLIKNTEINTANVTYTNSTAPNGTVYNVTAIITNTNGSAQTSWNWTTLQNYITTNVTYFDRDNISINLIFNVSYISPGTQQWGYHYSATDAGNTYDWTYENGTIIQSLTATALNETLEFMESPVLPTRIYHIRETVGASTMTIHANSWGMFNNWTSTMTFAGIAANESNDICYTYYNVTSGLWESYYVGYSWNADYQLSKDASVMGYFDAQTDITSNIITPSSTELYTGWNMLGIQSSSNQTISGVIADIGANCSDSWYFNSSTGSYSNTTTYSIQPNQGFLVYITQNMTWIRSTI